jgi:serine/threonine protein kinase
MRGKVGQGMTKLEGTRLGAYEILERVGGGGMAEVYLARQRTAFDREVAIKVIRKGYAEDEDFRARFLREARVISHLNHPHILPLIEFGEGGENGELLFLVMPYVSGGTLRDRIRDYGGPLPLRETLRIFSQLCEAVDYAHQRNLVHRDLKPSNVLMQDNRNILLADFGIALDFGDPRLTVTGMGLGTAEYMAPEQARGQADKRSDVYSLGVVLFVMLSGHAPYTGSTPFDVLMKQAAEPIPPLKDFNPNVPPQIEQIMQTAMAKLPEQRFQSAQALLNALEEAQIQAGINMSSSSVMPAIRPSDLLTSRESSQPSLGNTPTPAVSTSEPHTPPPGSGVSGPHTAPTTSESDQIPTLRVGMAASGPQPAITPPADLQPTGATQMEATHQAPPASGPASSQMPAPSGMMAAPPAGVSGSMGMSASNPAMPAVYPGVPLSNPPTPLPPGVITAPPPPTPAGSRKKRSALIIALVMLLIGTTAASALFFLNKSTTGQPGTTTRVPTATQKPAPLTFTPGTPCSTAAANPVGPTPDRLKYVTPQIVDQGFGLPAYVAVDYNSTLYFTDQAQRSIFYFSPYFHPANNQRLGDTLGSPSGIAIPAAPGSPIYFLSQTTSSGKTVQQLAIFDTVNHVPVPQAALDQGGNEAANVALAVNPTSKAVLIPNGATGTLYCLSAGSTQPQTAITGLKDPVAAIADAAGNIYVADMGANEILRFPPNGTSPDWHKSFAAPADLVLDSQGYLLATLQGTGPGQGSVVRINPTNGEQLDTLMSGLQKPLGIAFDTGQFVTNTVYFVDQGSANAIYAMCTSLNGICR